MTAANTMAMLHHRSGRFVACATIAADDLSHPHSVEPMTVTSEARVFFHPRHSCSAQLFAGEYLANAETSVSDGCFI
jgi:hypothetical protein